MLGGDTYSGKTSFLDVITGHSFNNNTCSTISARFISKNLIINNSEIYFDIWDTCSWDGHLDNFVKIFLKESNGIL